MTLILEKALKEVENLILSYPEYRPSGKSDLKKYIGTSLPFRGWSTPDTRKIFREGFSFDRFSPSQQLNIWDYIWINGSLFESRIFALMFLKDHYKKMDSLLLWEVIQHWTKQIDNWVFSDELSAKYSFLLEQEEDLVYEKLKYWNQSDFSWERRQSVVSLLYYHRQRRTFLSYDKYIQLVHPLLEDKDYFVQKGVGWALREIYQQYPEETLIYIFEHALKIAAPAYTAVTEKLPEELRVQFRALRSEFRQKNRKQTD